MHSLLKPKCQKFFLKIISTQKNKHRFLYPYCTMTPKPVPSDVIMLCNVVSSGIGGLDDLEASLDQCKVSLTSSLVTQVIDSCKNEAPTRRLLRFFSWSKRNLNCHLGDADFNHAIRVFAEKKDFTVMDILMLDCGKENRAMETHTFGIVAEALVKLGREDKALSIFKNLDKFKCPQDEVTVAVIVNALCAKGRARRAEGVVYHHKDKISRVKACIYKSLLYGWTVQENVKEARRIIKEMKAAGIMPDLYCFNTFLRCLCKQNLKSNPSGLVPEALNMMMEMRTYGIAPTSISYNILLSCLGSTRRVKESLRILESMRKSGCSPDWVSYYLVARVLYLSGRFGKGNQVVDKMIEEGLIPDCRFYYDLIRVLCGVERVNFALELFERMKRGSLGGYGPVYDVLIPKLCRGGDFEKGRELWDEATSMGVSLCCPSDVLDPSITEVFKPARKIEDDSLVDCTTSSNRARVGKTADKKKMNRTRKKKKKKQQQKKKDDTSA